MKKASQQVIKRKKILFLIIGILSFFCLLGSIILLLFYDYYPVVSRVEQVDSRKKKDTENYETVGWLRVQGTNIDYPVIYAPPSYSFSDLTGDFLWNKINSDELLNQVSISGHNYLNLSANPVITDPNHRRFEQLLSFVYLDFAEKNKYIQYTFQGEDYIYKIFSISFAESIDIKKYTRENLKSDEMKNYIKQSLEDSIFKFDIDVNENDKIISLITCTRMFQYLRDVEFKIDARLVRKGELKLNYGVSKTEKYKEVEEMMKGGREDEEV